MAYPVKMQSILVRFKHFSSMIAFFFFFQQFTQMTLFHFPLIAPLKQVLKGCRTGRCLHGICFFHITLGGIAGLFSLKGIVPHQVWKEMTTKNSGNVPFFLKSWFVTFLIDYELNRRLTLKILSPPFFFLLPGILRALSFAVIKWKYTPNPQRASMKLNYIWAAVTF